MMTLKRRVPQALEKVFLSGNIGDERPGAQPSQVFDTRQGFRIIISRELVLGGGLSGGRSATVLHVSASTHGKPAEDLEAQPFMERLEVLVPTLIGCQLRLLHWTISEGGVVHFFFDDPTGDPRSPTKPQKHHANA